MYAVYNKQLEEVYFASNKELVDMFLNDRCRNPKNFIVKKIEPKDISNRGIIEIESKEIFEAYGCNRAITPDEAQFFDEISIYEIYMMRNNLASVIKDMEKLELSKEEKDFCDYVFKRYNSFLSTVIEFEYGDEEDCYGWMEKFCSLNALYDKIIRNWTGV